MRKDDLYVKYRAARKAADDVATTYESGNTVAGMAWEREPKRGEPFPRQVQLVGAAWVAYRYECAARKRQSCKRRSLGTNIWSKSANGRLNYIEEKLS